MWTTFDTDCWPQPRCRHPAQKVQQLAANSQRDEASRDAAVAAAIEAGVSYHRTQASPLLAHCCCHSSAPPELLPTAHHADVTAANAHTETDKHARTQTKREQTRAKETQNRKEKIMKEKQSWKKKETNRPKDSWIKKNNNRDLDRQRCCHYK